MASPNHPLIVALGDVALLVRFGDTLDGAANRAAIAFARRVRAEALPAVTEVASTLVSTLVRFDPASVDGDRLAGELSLIAARDVRPGEPKDDGRNHRVAVDFDGPDLGYVSETLGLSEVDFVAAHNERPLRVLAIGFAPGFVYCGFHPEKLHMPRRTEVRPSVPAGTVLFAAGQTAIAATPVPTGWHVIGHTDLRNFDPDGDPPVAVLAGDVVKFEVAG